MEKTLLIFFLLASVIGFSQDKLYLNSGDSITGKITSIEKDYFIIKSPQGNKGKIPVNLVLNYKIDDGMNDFIIKTTGDTIKCKITFVNENNIFFDYRPIPTKNKIVSTNILRSSVASFNMPVQFQTANIQMDSLNTYRNIAATLVPSTLAGNELIISANSMFTAMGIYGGSVLISIIGVTTLVPPLYFIGGIGSIVAIIFYIKSWTHINKAGIILKKNRL